MARTLITARALPLRSCFNNGQRPRPGATPEEFSAACQVALHARSQVSRSIVRKVEVLRHTSCVQGKTLNGRFGKPVFPYVRQRSSHFPLVAASRTLRLPKCGLTLLPAPIGERREHLRPRQVSGYLQSVGTRKRALTSERSRVGFRTGQAQERS
jgi:hypothetical protein